MLKTLNVYRIAPGWAGDLAAIMQALRACLFVACGPTQQKSSGFVPPREDHGAIAESVDGQIITKLMSEQRMVPGDVLRRRTDEIAKQMEQTTGRKPGKKVMKELKEQALLELLPVAFTKRSAALIWIDPTARLLVVDSASQARAEEVVTLLIKCLDGLALSLVQTEMSPAVAMAHWLGTGEAPYQFSIDRECELKSCDEMKSTVKYGRHPLDIDQVREHITSGKVPTKLAMTWRDRVSFVLTDAMQIKKLSFLEVVFEGNKDMSADAFDADAAIATGELRQLLPDLFEALGGEQALHKDAA
jgi:recombination associated protein RdgC